MKRLEYLWKLASIPTVSTARITQMLKTHRDKMTNAMKSINAKKKNRYRNRLRISRSQVKLFHLIYLLVNALNLENAAALVNDEYCTNYGAAVFTRPKKRKENGNRFGGC